MRILLILALALGSLVTLSGCGTDGGSAYGGPPVYVPPTGPKRIR